MLPGITTNIRAAPTFGAVSVNGTWRLVRAMNTETEKNGGNYMIRATAYDGLVRAFAIDATTVVEELKERHGTDPAVTAALGRLATGTLLLGFMHKEEDQLVTVRVKGDGPAGTLLASANGKGEVRGLVANPRPDIEQVRNGKLNVSGA